MKSLFCGFRGTLTREDAWPSWLMRELYPPGVVLRKGWGVGNEGTDRGHKIAADLRVKIPRVCRNCNTDWLGAVEDRAKAAMIPWIRGNHGTLSESDERLLAFWAVKTAMTVQLAYPAPRRPIPARHYAEVHRNGDHPPGGVYVWAGVDDDVPTGEMLLFGTQPIEFDFGASSRTYVAYQVTMILNHLVLKVVGHDGPGELQLGVIFSNMDAVRPLLKIWPTEAGPT